MINNCTGTHRYFVADVAVVEAAGKVCVITICTACGDAKCKEFRVAEPRESFQLTKKEKESNVSI